MKKRAGRAEAALKAKRAAAEQDAERYRWLRSKGGEQYSETASMPSGTKPCIYMRLPSLNESGSCILREEHADAAIDAARKGKP